MTALVLDASTVLSWCFEDEAAIEAEALIDLVAARGAAVPAIWLFEVANGLVSAVRRKRITIAESNAFAAMIEALPITIDEPTLGTSFHDTIGLARRYSLSAYDAAYAELAARLALPLASHDGPLRRAAATMGIRLMPDAGESSG